MATEKILYFDCFSGICGDMTLAAFVDIGVPEDHLKNELMKLNLPGWRLRFSPGAKNGIGGTRADVDLLPLQVKRSLLSLRTDARAHDHRAYREIKTLIEGSSLPRGTVNRALAIFGKLAEAEAKVHGTSVAEVRFHEVGAVDSIVDIVGAAIGLEYLVPDRVLCSRIELGGGFVKCQHGLIPVPAPAVVEILKGIPVKSGTVQMETTTPTGAAILAACVDEYTDDKRFSILKTAYGVGHRDTDIPNLLRLFLGERTVKDIGSTDDYHAAPSIPSGDALLPSSRGSVLECNIDDMSPELHGYLFERLLGTGAQDVWLTPIVMKKSRPAITLSVLCAPETEAGLVELIFRETSTLGLRRYCVEKAALERSIAAIDTSLGPVRVKTAYLSGSPLKAKPEYEDLHRIALERGMPLREVQERVMLEINTIPRDNE